MRGAMRSVEEIAPAQVALDSSIFDDTSIHLIRRREKQTRRVGGETHAAQLTEHIQSLDGGSGGVGGEIEDVSEISG